MSGPERTEIQRRSLGADPGSVLRMPPGDLAIRFGFGAAVSVVAGLVGLGVGERAGGMLLAFPAILPAALTLIEKREGTSEAVADVRGAVIGAAALVGFAVTVVALAGRIPVVLAIVVAAAGWGVAGVGLYFLGTGLAGALGEQSYLPEVGVVEAEPLVEELRRLGLRLAVAETGTGGALAALVCAARDGPEVLRGAVVATEDERGWRLLGLEPPAQGEAMTEARARALACAARTRLDATVGIGIAGPLSGGDERGLTWVAVEGPRGGRATMLVGDRGPEQNRADAIRAALRLCHEVLGSR